MGRPIKSSSTPRPPTTLGTRRTRLPRKSATFVGSQQRYIEAQGSQARAMQNAGYGGPCSGHDGADESTRRDRWGRGVGVATTRRNPANPSAIRRAGGPRGAASPVRAEAVQPAQSGRHAAFTSTLSTPASPRCGGERATGAAARHALGSKFFPCGSSRRRYGGPCGSGYGNGAFGRSNQLRSA